VKQLLVQMDEVGIVPRALMHLHRNLLRKAIMSIEQFGQGQQMSATLFRHRAKARTNPETNSRYSNGLYKERKIRIESVSEE
jgi:hypothetical protein